MIYILFCRLFCHIFIMLGLMYIGSGSLFAQEANRHLVMGLKEDVTALQQQIGNVSLEMEALKTENNNLKTELNALKQSSQNAITPQDLEMRIQNLKTELENQLNQDKQDILKQLSKKLDQAAPAPAPKSTGEKVIFTEDYPKTGIVYIVQSGDTLSKIAQEQHSTVKDIQNANKISDPKSLQVGQEIFIPQK